MSWRKAPRTCQCCIGRLCGYDDRGREGEGGRARRGQGHHQWRSRTTTRGVMMSARRRAAPAWCFPGRAVAPSAQVRSSHTAPRHQGASPFLRHLHGPKNAGQCGAGARHTGEGDRELLVLQFVPVADRGRAPARRAAGARRRKTSPADATSASIGLARQPPCRRGTRAPRGPQVVKGWRLDFDGQATGRSARLGCRPERVR